MNLCKNCNKTVKRKVSIYCDNKCQKDYEYKILVSKWLRGEITGSTGRNLQTSNFVRKYLKFSRGSACNKCGWDEHHPSDNKSLTEIDHIDGDASNTTPENLEILCPNCHSMTSTFRARNKVSARNRS